MQKNIWSQWDAQTNDKYIAKCEDDKKRDSAYIQLNNLYLSIERGDIKLNKHHSNTLQVLLGIVYEGYSATDGIVAWWLDEFTKLPNWFDF